MTDPKKAAKNPNAAAVIQIDFAPQENAAWWIGGNDPAFTDSDNETVQECYAGKEFRVKINGVSSERLDQLRRKHTKTRVKKGVAIHDTNHIDLTKDLFVECVQDWEGIGAAGSDKPLPCDSATKRKVAGAVLGFANAVVGAALERSEALARDDDGEVQRFP